MVRTGSHIFSLPVNNISRKIFCWVKPSQNFRDAIGAVHTPGHTGLVSGHGALKLEIRLYPQWNSETTT
jgi:hypothetical protein